MNALHVALVNDYEVVARGVVGMLRSYTNRIRVVELDLNKQVDERVDIALYDTFAGTQGDRAVVHQLAANSSIGAVVVYSWNLDPAHIAAVLRNGADGYVSKGLPASKLVAALEAIHVGSERVHLGGPNTPTVQAGDWPGREEGLTEREAEVLALITQGLSNLEIAERTHLSINSIKTYIRSCYRAIGVTSRTTAVLWGIEHGFRPDRVRIEHPEPSPGTAEITVNA
ncbi:response regulator transcription factor [Salinibacterium sp. NSLL150]|uniref:helix-turn-helix transcriptional regulator n=1 Tax=unclassified Salinibacterium TaxID=2632331 RepID=UPI0018CED5E0|nr:MULTISPECIES: response regulator transcription factor [unclassified Salinibacterium]MBH0099327.1 response regulator transcription factor [Salinibacterium sp. NSLL35]MBH0102081.1 response regulator transcription factor [Salinibacterium sp. NSLL150]MBH0104841.1 response regulator transcription factor [Salinibacterium sp. NSLL16]MBH0107601.1 response regulator transcription factor [Salinibacterium sp. NSLL17]